MGQRGTPPSRCPARHLPPHPLRESYSSAAHPRSSGSRDWRKPGERGGVGAHIWMLGTLRMNRGPLFPIACAVRDRWNLQPQNVCARLHFMKYGLVPAAPFQGPWPQHVFPIPPIFVQLPVAILSPILASQNRKISTSRTMALRGKQKGGGIAPI